MFLKKLLLFITINTLLFGGLLASDFSVEIDKIDNNSVSVEFNSTNYFGENQDNWIALFKKNTTNIWANVRSWAWIKDLPLYPTETPNSEARKFSFQGEDDGEYEIRFFENNSYTPHTRKIITLENANNQPFIEISAQNLQGDLIITSSNADEAWVGIFRKDVPSERENILNWKWVRADNKSYFNTNSLENGVYEARLFFQNSYDLEAKVEFTLNQDDIPQVFTEGQTYNGEGNIEVSIQDDAPHAGGEWIGMFKPNVVHKIDNLVAYAYVRNGVNTVELITYQSEFLGSGEYTLVYFVRNSYIPFGQKGTIAVNLD
jgi:hypothetical protein